MEPVTSLIPPVTLEQMRQGILYIQQVLHSEGMTAVKDPDIDQLHWDAYKSLLDQGQLKERICVLWHAGSTMESARKALAEINAVPRLPATLGDDRLLSCGAKIYMDGSGGARTGWVYDDWLRNATTQISQVRAQAITAIRKPIPLCIKRWSGSSTRMASRLVPTPSATALWTGSSIPTLLSSRSTRTPVCATASSMPICPLRMRST